MNIRFVQGKVIRECDGCNPLRCGWNKCPVAVKARKER